jgi:hypothetical protein
MAGGDFMHAVRERLPNGRAETFDLEALGLSPQQAPRPAVSEKPNLANQNGGDAREAEATKPWFAGSPAPKPKVELSQDAIDEFVQGWRAGNLAWPRRLLGEPPGHPDCKLSREDLRRNGL